MPTRNISTKLAIEGESQYRASVQAINAELRSLQSSLQLTESEFRTNANSIEALSAKDKALNALKEAQKAKVDALRVGLENAQKAVKAHADAQEAARKKIEDAKAALEKLKTTEGDTSKEQQRLTEEIKKGEEELRYHEDAMASAQKGVNNWQTDLNKAQIRLNDLDAEVKLNAEYLAEAEKSADGCATSIDRFGDRIKESASKADDFATALADAGVIQAVGKVTDALKECFDEAVQFEAQMAAVSRTTGITNEVTAETVITLDELAGEIRQMSAEMPITTEQLAAIATTAGQLGIAQENVVEFTRIMAMLGTTTDLTADDAATMLAQFANVTKLDPANYDRLGATVAALGDSTATTASKIVQMSQGMGAVGSIAGMSERDVLAIAAAVGSVGVEAQAGATAMNTFIQNISKSISTGGETLETFAGVAGMTAGEFSAAWKNDAAEALNAVIQGLGSLEDRGEDVNLVLEDLGVTNARQVKTILSLAEAGDLLTTTLSMADQAWESNTALADKAGTMYGTTQAQIDIMNNKIGLLKEAIGSAFAPTISEAAEKVGDFAQGLSAFAEEHPQLVQAIGAVVGALAALTTGLAAFQAAKKAASILELGTAFSNIGTAASSAITAVEGLATAIGGSLAAGLGLIAGMILPVVAGIYEIGRSCKETMEIGFIGDGHTAQEYADNVQYYTDRIGELEAEYETLSNAGADLTGVQYELDNAHVGLAHAMQEQADAAETAAESTEELAEAELETAEATEEVNGAVEDIKISLAALAESYNKAYNAAYESIRGQIGLFGEFKATLDEDLDSVSEMEARWKSQADAVSAYTENLQKAQEYNISDALLRELSDGSAESAAYLAQIVSEVEAAGAAMGESMPDAAASMVEEINSSYQSAQLAMAEYAAQTALLEGDIEAAIAALQEEAAAADFTGFSEALVEAFAAEGVDVKSLGLDLAGDVASGVEEGASSAQGSIMFARDSMLSPLLETPDSIRQSGLDAPLRFAEGFTENAAAAAEAVTTAGDDISAAASNAGSGAADAFTEQFDQLQSETAAAMDSVQSTIASYEGTMFGAGYEVGDNITGGMIAGLDAQSSTLYAKIRNMTNNAIQEAKTAAATASPSKKTTKIFEDVGEGMVVGLEHKEKDVGQKAQEVVNDALDLEIPSIDLSNVYTGIPTFQPDNSAARLLTELSDMKSQFTDLLTAILTSDKGIYFNDGVWAARLAPKINRALA